ncbi:MAG: undecaprenyl diphosphate synthase family protein [Nanoarchaeota archaeon]|nr:undecaprenyl diphosphate synthase family protein [Nanoarchaeota archaeon]
MAMHNHIAIGLDDISDWGRENNIDINEGLNRYFELLNELVKLQVKLNVPIFTIYLLPDIEKSTEYYLIFSEKIIGFFNDLSNSEIVSKHKMKISIFGKWYKLPGKAVEALKSIIENTKEYDNFFVNFCINYDGQEEIVDACKLIARQVELGKIDPEMITKESIKENIYSSYFLPPDVILIYGEKKLSGILLWDSVKSNIVFADKSFMEFEEEDLGRLNRNLFK